MPIFQGFGRFGGLGGGPPVGGNDPNYGQTVLLMGYNGADTSTTMSDESPAAHGFPFTVGGNAQLDTAQTKFGTASLLLDGTGDYINYADHADWEFGSGQFTVEAWIRFNVASGWQTIACHWEQVASSSWVFDWTGSNLRFGYDTNGDSVVDGTSEAAWSPSANTWYHVAADRDGSNNLRTYVNGSMISKSTAAVTFFNAAAPLYIGRLGDPTFPHYFNGWIDEFRITKGVARYASDGGYVTPTMAFPRS